MELRNAVCFCLLALAACGGDAGADHDTEQFADAGSAAAEEAGGSRDLQAREDGGTSSADEIRADAGIVYAEDASASLLCDHAPNGAQLQQGDVGYTCKETQGANDGGVFDLNAPSDGSVCVMYFRDADGDGYGDRRQPSAACGSAAVPAEGGPYVPNGDDCYDANSLARPGQTGRFSVDRGDGSFDYDCDGKETGIYTTVAVCPDVSSWTCPPPTDQEPGQNCDYNDQLSPYATAEEGWAREVPPCGVRDGFGLNLSWDNTKKTYYCWASAPGSTENTMTQICR